jgi:predicted ATPase
VATARDAARRSSGIVRTDYEDTDHYRLTRAFLEAPQAFLARLFDED